MDSLALIALLLVWVSASAFVVVKGPSMMLPKGSSIRMRVGMGVVLSIAICLATFGDELWGRIKTDRLCKSEGGTKIYKTVADVAGVQMIGSEDAILRARKYRFIESIKSTVSNGTYVEGPARFSLTSAGQIFIEKDFKPEAGYSYQKRVEFPSDRIIRTEQRIENLKTGEVLATDTRFDFTGGWLARWLLAGYGGGGLGAGCKLPTVLHDSFLFVVLKPIS